MAYRCDNCGETLDDDEVVVGDANDAAPFPDYHVVPDGRQVDVATFVPTVCGPVHPVDDDMEDDEPRYGREPLDMAALIDRRLV